jgi:hypothetical protein
VAYSFRVRATNAAGNSAYSNVAAADTIPVSPPIDFSGGFASASGLTLNGTAAKIVGSSLQLTDGAGNEASSIFTTSTINVQRFITSFTFQQTTPNADGMTFTIQGVGPTAVGGNGGSLGYGPTGGTTGGIASSVAIKFDLFSNNGEGTDSTGLFTNGAAPTNTGSVDMTPSFVNLHTSDPMLVTLQYDGATLVETITDTVNHASFSRNYSINIPGTVGGNAAYVGFTGGTGGQASTQTVLSWTFTPLPVDFIYGTTASDAITLTRDVDAQHIDWTMGTSPQQSMLINDPNGLTIYGNGAADVVNLVYTNGNPLPNILHLNSLPSVGGTFTVNGLSGADPLATTTVDLGKSKVFLSYSNLLTNASTPSPISLVAGWLSKGYNGGAWNGTVDAINSAQAAVNNGYMIGYADSADGTGTNTNTNTVELMYTLGGDLNLTGTVVFNGFALVVANYGKPAAWDTGAITYGATVSFADFALTVSNYGKQANLSVTASAPTSGATATASATASTWPLVVSTTATDNPKKLQKVQNRRRHR